MKAQYEYPLMVAALIALLILVGGMFFRQPWERYELETKQGSISLLAPAPFNERAPLALGIDVGGEVIKDAVAYECLTNALDVRVIEIELAKDQNVGVQELLKETLSRIQGVMENTLLPPDPDITLSDFQHSEKRVKVSGREGVLMDGKVTVNDEVLGFKVLYLQDGKKIWQVMALGSEDQSRSMDKVINSVRSDGNQS